jgi:hypothetical protein
MANAIKWEAAWTSRSTVLTTELNALADAAYSAIGTEIDNATNLDTYGKVVVVLASLDPAAGAVVELYMVTAPDGTNYDDAPSATNLATHLLVAVIPVDSASSAKRCMSPVFMLQPAKTKFYLRNACGVAFAATGSTVTLYTSNDEVQ